MGDQVHDLHNKNSAESFSCPNVHLGVRSKLQVRIWPTCNFNLSQHLWAKKYPHCVLAGASEIVLAQRFT